MHDMKDFRKYEVGEKVRIKDNLSFRKTGIYSIADLKGTIATVVECLEYDLYKLDMNRGWTWSAVWLEPVGEQESIHITTKGTTTIGVLKMGDKVIKRVEARLHPDDKYDYETGVHICMSRMFDDNIYIDTYNKETGKHRIISKISDNQVSVMDMNIESK